jgi:tetratricopeptide (TPR) repeat protein
MGPPRQQALSIDVQTAIKPTTRVTESTKDLKNNNPSSIHKAQAQTPSTRQSCESQLFRFDDDDETDDNGDGGVLTETQLVLLCLDYLRTLGRSYTTEELRASHGLDRGAIVRATDSLRQCFLPPSDTTNACSTSTPSGSSQPCVILQPSQLHVDNDPIRPPQTPTSSKHNPSKFEYDDSHPSNRYRFFPLNGLSTPPLTLGEIVASGLVGLNARSRGDAELDICSNELFHQFLAAVKARGFFAATNNQNQEDTTTEKERYQKVVDKFRMKLAANAAKEAQSASRLSPLSIYSSTSMSPTTLTHHRVASPAAYSIASPKAIPGSTTSITTTTTTRPDSTRVLAMTMAEKQRVHQQKQQQRQQPYSFDDHDDADKYTTQATQSAATTTNRDVEQREEHNEDEGEEEEEENDMIETYNSVDVERAEKYKLSGNNYNEAGKFDKAVECYTQALQLCPSGSNSHIYYSNRSAAYLGLERYEECLDDCERALALKPDYVKAYTRMGWALFHLKEYEYAMDSFEMSMKLDPTNAHTHRDPYLKAREAWEKEQAQQQHSEQREEEQRTANKNKHSHADDNHSPKSETSSQFSPRTSEMEDESRRNRESMIRQKEADGYKSKGNSYMAHRDWVRAVEAYSTAIQLCSNGPRSYVYFANRSAALCHLQQYEEAELDAADSVSLNPEYGKAYARLGLSRFFLEDYHGAVEAYENAIYYEPDNAASRSYLAKAKKRIMELSSSGGGVTE